MWRSTNNWKTNDEWVLQVEQIDNAWRTSFNTIFGDKIVAHKNDSILAKFDLGLIRSDFNITELNGATASENSSTLILQSGTATNWSVIIESKDRTIYHPWHDIYSYFTYAWPDGWVVWSENCIWSVDSNNWYFIWYVWEDFVISRRHAWVDYTVTRDNWNWDKLNWTWPSWITIDFTKINIFRLNYWYLWVAPCIFEVQTTAWWVEFHRTSTLNSLQDMAIENPNLPIRAWITKTSWNTNIRWMSWSWNWWYYNWNTSYVWNKANHYDTWATGEALTWTWKENVVIFHLKDTFNWKPNTIPARMVHSDFQNTATWDIIFWEIIANPTSVWWTAIWSLTYTDIDANNSVVEYSASWWVVVWWKTIYSQYMVWWGWWSWAFAWWWSVTAQELWLIWRPWDYFACTYTRVSWSWAYNALFNINWIELF